MNQLAMYAGYLTMACTAGHQLVKAFRPVAALTPSKADDQALDTLDKVLSAIENVLGSFAWGKRAPS